MQKPADGPSSVRHPARPGKRLVISQPAHLRRLTRAAAIGRRGRRGDPVIRRFRLLWSTTLMSAPMSMRSVDGPRPTRSMRADRRGLDRWQIVSLACLAHWTRNPGRWSAKRFIGRSGQCARLVVHGRLIASPHNPVLKAFRNRLFASREPRSIVATTGKLLTSSTPSSGKKSHGTTPDCQDGRPLGHWP
ncbi:hypothetical protein RHI9324_05101 [Rhizobium sp. CECT 9324]|nr:hypothetical protein RHI9324_05101 [Rhizobium sp. CECT 9324]